MRVLYPGGFDLFHHGHRAALATARAIAGTGHLTVGINSDTFMRHYKREPHDSEQARIGNVRATALADDVIIWDGPEGQADQILDLNPDIYIAGVDWLTKDLAAQLGLTSLAWFEHHNIGLMFMRRTAGVSTTQLIASC